VVVFVVTVLGVGFCFSIFHFQRGNGFIGLDFGGC